MKEIVDAFYKSGLVMEFFETLINDKSVPERLRRQVWTMISTEWDLKSQAIHTFADTFGVSTDEIDLATSWAFHVGQLWPAFPECSLKAEIDGRSPEVIL